ncbi:Uncharacterised protein [Shigella sonnei]|nr:Uncharacterised protein [Shigella sonnei]
MISIPSLRLASPKRQLSKTLVAYCSIVSSLVVGTINTAICTWVLLKIDSNLCVSSFFSCEFKLLVRSVTCCCNCGTIVGWAATKEHTKVNISMK